ncbi:MAG: electron transfer flavoprotein subunit alpha/FixB family protein, partial [Deltaproteobacteria bacterium]|nr:electron transfer flavoprotein subunit alpha/FixB family protein [Deltaproteobacteria bacterium]
MGATPQGRDLAPRLARRLRLGLTADCTQLDIDPEAKILRQTRPAFGGNVMAAILSRFSRPQMATVRPGIMEALQPDPQRKGQVVKHRAALSPSDLGAVLLRTVAQAGRQVDLTQARVVVAGGRGLDGGRGFELLQELASVLGGEVGGTRVAFEEGWIPQERQIGQTGVTVRPELYVACGLSGAIQHRAGMLDSRYIVAINKDPAAPIFEVADFGLVGDLRTIVPALISAVKEG